MRTITGRVGAVPRERRPRVYYARGPRGLETGLGGSINVETIELLAQNVAARTRGGLANVSIEQVLLWNPDVIITIDQDFAASVRSDPRLGAGQGGARGRVHLSPKLPFGWVDFPPCVNRLIGLWWLAKILYPELFPGGLERAHPRFLRALLSRDAERRADRPRAGGTGLMRIHVRKQTVSCPRKRAPSKHRWSILQDGLAKSSRQASAVFTGGSGSRAPGEARGRWPE